MTLSFAFTIPADCELELVNDLSKSQHPIVPMSACFERFTAAVPRYICRASQRPDHATFSNSLLS